MKIQGDLMISIDSIVKRSHHHRSTSTGQYFISFFTPHHNNSREIMSIQYPNKFNNNNTADYTSYGLHAYFFNGNITLEIDIFPWNLDSLWHSFCQEKNMQNNNTTNM